MTVRSILAFLLSVAPGVLPAQTGIDGIVRDHSGKPIAEVRIRTLRSASSAVTKKDGTFRIDPVSLPETLVFTAVGFRPDSLAMLTAPDARLEVVLEQWTLLEELAVSAEREPQVPRPAALGEWSLGQRAMRASPPAVEADVMRSLVLVPAVGFSSVLSARPILRGYEPNHTTVRVDGFEMPNLYRIGRFFSSFPVDATERVTVTTAPAGDFASGLAGHIDLDGRSGRSPGFGGGGLSFGSLGAYGGGRPAGIGAFGAVRFLHVSALSLAGGHKLPANFLDAYSRLDLGGGPEPRGSLNAFFSGDDYGHFDREDGARWHSLLLGGRYAVLRTASTAVNVEASLSQFHQDIANGPTQRLTVDVRTRLDLGRLGVSARHRAGRFEIEGGGSVNRRAVENDIRANQHYESTYRDLVPYTLDASYTEAHSFGSLTWSDSTIRASAGVRLEHSPWATIVAPRVSLERQWTPHFSAGVALGRTGALYQYISDPASEPDVAYYDYWLISGRDGFAAPRIDHASLDARWHRGALQLRATAYASRGTRLVEVRPPSSQVSAPDDFRRGKSRTDGLELQAILSPGARPDRVASFTYVLSRSQRNWGDGWIPWALDRRHLVRLQLATTIARRWRVDVLGEYTSGVPYTPVRGVLTSTGGIISPGLPFIYGQENSARDYSRFRADLGFTHHFNGPHRSRLLWGVSLLNVTWGRIVPLLLDDAPLTPTPGEPLGYHRVGRIPVAPTLTLRVEF